MTDKPFLERTDLHTRAPFRSALLTQPGNLAEALKQAQADPTKTLLGVGQGIPSVFITKLIASTKPDFIWIDVEHGMFGRLELNDAIQAAQYHSEGKSMVIVRVPKHDTTNLITALDAGASGFVLPHTESAQDVKDFIKEVYYPPIGARSFSPHTFTPNVSNASLYPNDPYNMVLANKHIAAIAQIESVKGLENIEEIAAVEGLTGLMFGPGDYSADAGIPLPGGPEPANADLSAAKERFYAVGRKHGKPIFGGAHSLEVIPSLIESGYRAIAVTMDNWAFTTMMDYYMKGARALAGQGPPPAPPSL